MRLEGCWGCLSLRYEKVKWGGGGGTPLRWREHEVSRESTCGRRRKAAGTAAEKRQQQQEENGGWKEGWMEGREDGRKERRKGILFM